MGRAERCASERYRPNLSQADFTVVSVMDLYVTSRDVSLCVTSRHVNLCVTT